VVAWLGMIKLRRLLLRVWTSALALLLLGSACATSSSSPAMSRSFPERWTRVATLSVVPGGAFQLYQRRTLRTVCQSLESGSPRRVTERNVSKYQCTGLHFDQPLDAFALSATPEGQRVAAGKLAAGYKLIPGVNGTVNRGNFIALLNENGELSVSHRGIRSRCRVTTDEGVVVADCERPATAT
jgi:hypothetical protein